MREWHDSALSRTTSTHTQAFVRPEVAIARKREGRRSGGWVRGEDGWGDRERERGGTIGRECVCVGGGMMGG